MFLAIVVPSILTAAILNLLDVKKRRPTGNRGKGSDVRACTRGKRGLLIEEALKTWGVLLMDLVLHEEKNRVANLVSWWVCVRGMEGQAESRLGRGEPTVGAKR